jgi:hypothetical protein
VPAVPAADPPTDSKRTSAIAVNASLTCTSDRSVAPPSCVAAAAVSFAPAAVNAALVLGAASTKVAADTDEPL